MGRAPCCEKNGLKKGPWTPEEDQKLIDYIQRHGHGGWRTLPKNAGLSRCGKSCRLRWTNYLRPDIKRGRFSFDEEETIIQLHSILGNKWSAIAARLPGRTDNEIKNYWNTHIRRRLLRMGIDPVTHSRRLDLLDLSSLLTNHPSLITFNPQAQFDVSRLLGTGSLGALGPELLRIASNLLQSQSQGSTNPPHPQIQFQDLPSCTTPASPRFFGDQASNMWQATGMNCNFRGSSAPAVTACDNASSYEDLEQLVPQFVSDDADFYLHDNQECYDMSMTTSVLSTPISSLATQLNSSSSTYDISGSTEDERDNYCSELFNFQIPDLLDVSDFM